jgi:hypothetical protein
MYRLPCFRQRHPCLTIFGARSMRDVLEDSQSSDWAWFAFSFDRSIIARRFIGRVPNKTRGTTSADWW